VRRSSPEGRTEIQTGRKCGGRKAAEIDVAAEIKLEDLSLGRTELNEICIGAELESVMPPVFARVSVNCVRRSMRSTVEYGSRPKYANPGMFTPISLPPGCERNQNGGRGGVLESNWLTADWLRVVSCWNTTLKSRDWL